MAYPAPMAVLHPVRRGDVVAALLGGLLLYVLTLAPGPWWGDSASFASHLDAPPTPFARSYWLYKMPARALAAFGVSPALAANLVSAAFGAVGVALASALAQRLGASRTGAAAAAGALAVSHTFWSNAVVAEVYTLHVALELAILHLALGAPRRPREALVLGVVAGLALNHHRMILFVFPAVALWLVAATPRRELGGVLGTVAAGLGVGALPWLVLCLLHPPSSLPVDDGAWRLWWQKAALGGRWSAAQMESAPGRTLAGNAAHFARFGLLNFPSPALPLAAWGAWRLRGRGLLLLAATAVLGCVAALRMDWTGDQHVYLLSVHPIVAVVAGVGLSGLAGSSGLRQGLAAATVALPLVAYGMLAFGDAGRALLPTSTDLERAATLWPPKSGQDLPERWCRARLEQLPPDAILVSQWSEGTVFEYLMRTERRRDDVALLFHRRGKVDLPASDRPVFVTWDPRAGSPPDPVWETGFLLRGDAPGFREVRER